MHQDKEIANFFWHGNAMSLYEQKCISSFVNHNFHVNVWSFTSRELPKGAILCDASKYFKIEDVTSINQDNKLGCIAAFSDAFRYSVLKDVGGWWFDTDCICLRDQEEFKKLKNNKSIIAGFENENIINGAVLNFVDPTLADQAYRLLTQILTDKNRNIKWGEIGPKLITQLVSNNNLLNEIYPQSFFYPVHWKNAVDALNPKLTDELDTKCSNSYVYHYWNEIIKKNKIDKNCLPPIDSFIYNKFLKGNTNG
jgi:hypothetical protein